MNAILITGNTYPNRRAVHGAGGRWSAELEGYLFDEAHAAAAEEVADRYAARAESREDRRDEIRTQLDNDPRASDWQFFTEPIKVGHHSERRHRRDRERISAKLDKAHTLWREAAELRGREAAARHAAQADAERPAAFMVRRLEELKAELRKTKRRLAGTDHSQIIRSEIDGCELQAVDPENDWGKRLTARRDELAEGIAYWQALLDARGGIAYSRDNVKPGDIIARGGVGGRA